MSKFQYACAFLILGFFITVQSFAGSSAIPDSQEPAGVKTHYTLALQYENLAQIDRSKADHWEFMADYYDKFPKAYHDTSIPLKEHIAHLRAISSDFKKAEEQARESAEVHHSLARHGMGPPTMPLESAKESTN